MSNNKIKIIILFIFSCFVSLAFTINQEISAIEIPFIENRGQIENPEVRFYTRIFCGDVFITKTGELIYSISPQEKTPEKILLHENFLNSRIRNISGKEENFAKINYLKGKDPAKWQRNIRTYKSLSLGKIYEGIELCLKANSKNVEKIFHIQPGANPDLIKIKIEEAKKFSVNKIGELEIETDSGVFGFTKPVAYQYENGLRKFTDVTYNIDKNSYSFELENYDKTKELIIDPCLSATMFGGNLEDRIYDMVLDSFGNVFITGMTESTSFPTTTGAYDENSHDLEDVFVAKLDANLENLLACTFIGADIQEWGKSIAIDDSGFVFVAGYTNSSDFPTTPNAYDPTFNGGSGEDVFILKLDNNLETLVSSTFLGGVQSDYGRSCCLDENGNIYVTGFTQSVDFPALVGSYDWEYNENSDVFVSKLDNNLETLLASTYLGDVHTDSAYDVFHDLNGYIYITGHTYSDEFPVSPGAYDPTYNGSESNTRPDVFVSKFTDDLSTLVASTYLGDPGDPYGTDYGWCIRTDTEFNIFVSGYTTSENFPTTPAAYDTLLNEGNEPGHWDSFLSKFDSNLENLLASTMVGGTESERTWIFTIDENDDIYISGDTNSDDFPVTPGCFDDSPDNGNIFISKFDNDLENLLVSTYLSADSDIDPYTMCLDPTGNVYIAGTTRHYGIQTTFNAYDRTHNGGTWDGFIIKFDGDLSEHPLDTPQVIITVYPDELYLDLEWDEIEMAEYYNVYRSQDLSIPLSNWELWDTTHNYSAGDDMYDYDNEVFYEKYFYYVQAGRY